MTRIYLVGVQLIRPPYRTYSAANVGDGHTGAKGAAMQRCRMPIVLEASHLKHPTGCSGKYKNKAAKVHNSSELGLPQGEGAFTAGAILAQ